MFEDVPSAVPSGELSGVIWLLVLLVLLLLWPLGLWALRHWKKWQVKDPSTSDEQLLVKISYLHDRETEGMRQGYLRSLTSDRATLVVADRGLRKGSQVRLDLGSLHPYSDQRSDMVLGRVTQMKSLGGSPENLLVNVQFLDHNVAVHELGRQH